MVKRKRNGVADCCDADDVDDSFANVTCMLLMRFICETLADMGTWRPYNGARRSCPGRAGRGAAHGDRRDLQLTVRGIDQKDFIMARPSSQPYLHDSSAQASEQAPQARPTASTATKCATRGSLRWRVIDIAVGAAVGVMSGVMFWVFDGLSYGLFPLLTLILPGSAALLHALFYFPATLGLLIVRKPGASAYVLLVASFVEVVLGTKYSVSLVVIALVQALAAEAVFAVFRYRRWTLGVTLLSAVAVGIVYNFYLLFFYYQAFSFFSPRGLIGTACELLSAVVFAGFGSWVLYRALAKSGVLTRFASGR